jgi:hypothetical protein
MALSEKQLLGLGRRAAERIMGASAVREVVVTMGGSPTQRYVKCHGPMRQLRAVCAASGCDRAGNIGRRLSYRSGGGR